MIEDIFGKAKQAASAAGKKTEELVEISKLKLSAMQVNTDIKALYEKLGSAVYSMQKAHYENPELVASLVEEIDDKRGDLKKIRDKNRGAAKGKGMPLLSDKNPRKPITVKNAAVSCRCRKTEQKLNPNRMTAAAVKKTNKENKSGRARLSTPCLSAESGNF